VKVKAKHRVNDVTQSNPAAPERVWVTVGRGNPSTYICSPPSGCAPAAPLAITLSQTNEPTGLQCTAEPLGCPSGAVVVDKWAATSTGESRWPWGGSVGTNAPVCLNDQDTIYCNGEFGLERWEQHQLSFDVWERKGKRGLLYEERDGTPKPLPPESNVNAWKKLEEHALEGTYWVKAVIPPYEDSGVMLGAEVVQPLELS
jgi:hypothetical protein